MALLPMDFDILPPSDDRVFKLLLTADGSKPILMDLISAVIGRTVVDAEVRNSEIPTENSREKAEKLDVNCRIDDGSQVDLEMQASRIEEIPDGKHQNLKGKSVYYLCDLHSSQPSVGVRYDKLAKTYQVTFCAYTVFPHKEDYINSFSMRHDKDNELLSDAIHVIYVELSKLHEIMKKSVTDMTDLEKWAVFFRYAGDPIHRETVNKVIESKEALQMASTRLMSISKDEDERARFRSRRMYQSDLQSNLATAEDRGRAEGRAEGIDIGRLEKGFEIAKKMLKNGKPLDEIAEMTDLPIEEIRKLRAN